MRVRGKLIRREHQSPFYAPRQIYLKFVPMRIRQAFAAGLIGMAPALTGCLTHTHVVPKTRIASIVMSTSLDQLASQINTRFGDIQTMNASVEISASTGGGLQGQVKESVSFRGYILMRKPESLRVLLLVPVLGTQALDMVTDGKTFTLLVPPRHKAMIGTNEVLHPSKNGLENLRPIVFFDSMFVQGPHPDQIISMTSDTRVIEVDKKKNDLVEEPAYAVQILAQPQGQIVRTLRVIHINSTDLLPYQQDIYDVAGRIATKAFYSDYQYYGNTPFPTTILIQRPQDHYSLTVTITKLTLNQKLDDDQFDLKIPEGYPIQNMN
jgi:outer membrane lipoprotein-sorting protein